MKGGNKARGFTIVETIIVLAVTGGLFVAVALTLSGRQQKTQFTQAVQEIQSQIQQVIDDVSVGYYPNSSNFSCSASLSGPSFGPGSTGQGENTGCTFIGKAIQFGVSGTDPEAFNVFTIAGLQKTPAGDEVTSYALAMPKAVSPSSSNPSAPDVTDTKKLQYGLTTCRTLCATGTPVGTVAFANILAGFSLSGAQQVNVIPITGSTVNATQQDAAQAINNNFAASPVNPSGGVKLCFVSGGTNQSGLITIGSNGRQLSVTLSIKGNDKCT